VHDNFLITLTISTRLGVSLIADCSLCFTSCLAKSDFFHSTYLCICMLLQVNKCQWNYHCEWLWANELLQDIRSADVRVDINSMTVTHACRAKLLALQKWNRHASAKVSVKQVGLLQTHAGAIYADTSAVFNNVTRWISVWSDDDFCSWTLQFLSWRTLTVLISGLPTV
jgi:hypothetical protein